MKEKPFLKYFPINYIHILFYEFPENIYLFAHIWIHFIIPNLIMWKYSKYTMVTTLRIFCKLFWVPCLSFEIFSLKNWAVAAIIDKCIAIDEMPRTLEWYCVMIAHTVRKLINNPIKQIETFLSRLSSYKTCFMSRKTTKKSHFIREYSEWALEADERFSLFHSQGSKIKRLKLF